MVTTIPDIAEKAHMSPDTLYRYAKRRDDPFPYRRLPGARYGFVLEQEAIEWFQRNAPIGGKDD